MYTQDPDTLNYLMTNVRQSSDVVTNVVDGLLENDRYGNLVPALAKSLDSLQRWSLTIPINLRKDAKWYTSEGEEYAGVKAQDLVTGFEICRR